MPIGKNAIKRVSVSTKPQEVDTKVVEEKIEVVEEAPKATKKPATKTAQAKKPAPKQTEKKPQEKKAPSTPKKSMETEPTFSPVKVAEKVIEKNEANPRQGDGYINLGGELPYYLL